MSTESNLFGNSEQKEQPAQETPKQEEQATSPETGGEQQQSHTGSFDQLLSGIKSADGRQKYSSVEDALKSMPHAQEHISQLERENREYKEKMSQVEELQQKIQRYEELLAKGPSQDSQSDNSGQGLDEATVSELVQRELTAAQQKQQYQKNGQAVVSALTDKFGSQQAAEEAFAKKAEELDVDTSFLTDLAYRSPKAVLSYFNTSSASAPAKPKGDVNTAQFQQEPKQQEHRLYGRSGDLVSNWRASAENVKKKLGQ